MGEAEQDLHPAKAVREHDQAQKTLKLLHEEASRRGFVCQNLAGVLRETPPEKLARELETTLGVWARERFDWSKLSHDSLSNLASGLKAAIREERRTREEEGRLRR